MGKRTHNITVKGELDVDHLRIKELNKDGDPIGFHSLGQLLNEFDGKVVTFSVKEEDEIAPSAE